MALGFLLLIAFALLARLLARSARIEKALESSEEPDLLDSYRQEQDTVTANC